MKVCEKVLKILIDRKMTISFAESCTGGACCSALVKIPNASWVLNESYVTYAIESKIKILGVAKETIDKYGVVSENVAKEMAIGVKRISDATIGVGITGLSGPSGDGINPIGTVCFGIAYLDKVYTYRNYFVNMNREEVINNAVNFAYERILEVLTNGN